MNFDNNDDDDEDYNEDDFNSGSSEFYQEETESLISDWLNGSIQMSDPKNILESDLYNYDKFTDWLDIADMDDDGGIVSLEETYKMFKQYGYIEHCKVIRVKINNVKTKLDAIIQGN